MAKKAATTLLSEARQELVETNAKLSDTGRRHDQLSAHRVDRRMELPG
jgi:hypothetical protein